MPHRSIKYAYAAMALFASAMAFFVIQILDETTVKGVSGVVRINESANTASGAQVVAMVADFAREHRVNIGREIADTKHPDSRRHLYVTVGNPGAESAEWLVSGYPGFSRNIETEVHPLGELSNRDPRGFYYIFGPTDGTDELLHRFAQLGLQGWHVPTTTWSRTVEVIERGFLASSIGVMALVVVVAVGSGVILNTRTYGIHRLHGHSAADLLALDLAGLGKYLAQVGALLVPGVAAILFGYNRLHQVTGFALLALGLFSMFVALAVVVHLLALALVGRATILGALKGEVPARWTMGGSYAIRIPALIVAVGAAAALITGLGHVRAQHSEMITWSTTGDAAYILLNGSLGGDTERLETSVGAWIRRSSERGEVIISRREPRGASALFPPNGPDRDVLVSNSAYLTEQAVVDATGNRVAGPRPSDAAVQVLIPQRHWDAREAILDGVREWVSFSIGSRPVAAPQILATPTRNDQSLFTYNISVPLGRDSRLRDPVMVVIPNGSPILSDVDYTAYATQNAVIFRDAAFARDSVAKEGLSEYVLAVNPVAENAATQYRAQVRELRLRMFNLAAALAVLVATALSVAMIYRRKHAQSLFAKYIFGWSFVRSYRSILAFEALLAMLLVGWSLLLKRPSPPDARGAPGTRATQTQQTLDAWEPLVATGIAVASLAFVAVALAVFNATMVKERSTQA